MNREDIIRMAKAFAWMRAGEKEAEDFLVDFFNAAYAAGAAAELAEFENLCKGRWEYGYEVVRARRNGGGK